MMPRKLPVGIQSFEEIRRNDYVYVDKTEYIWNLVESGKVYFLCRPRRFGKSLLVSTMEAYFRGKRDLFDGLTIQKLEDERGEKAWQSYPVIRFSLSGGNYHSEKGLSDRLNTILEDTAANYNLDEKYAIRGKTLPVRFQSLIERLYSKTGRQVVVLVDEYDKPLLETMVVNTEQEERNRQLYKGFFSILKDEDQYLKFVFFTGVTKFGKVSIFSDLNQLEDISLTDEYSGICGITESELLDGFQPEITSLSKSLHVNNDECMCQLKKMYNGYHFSGNGIGVYNPFSLLNAFKQKKLGQFWFATATPTFLVNKLRASSFTPEQFTNGVEITEMNLMDYQADDPDPIPLFYQSGYLTICNYDPQFQIYELKFPNDEVKYGFLNSLAKTVLGTQDSENPMPVRNMVCNLQSGKIEDVMLALQSLFAAIPYIEGKSTNYEQEWRNEVFLIFMLMGQYVSCEVHSAKGRADCVLKNNQYIYIFEFKLDGTAEAALQQIKDKGYANPYLSDKRNIICVGVSFSSEKRNIEEWKCESRV